MYVSPRVTDFGQIDLHTHTLASSPAEIDPTSDPTGAGGGAGIGLIGLVGGAMILAGRGDDNQPAAATPPDEEEEKQAQK